MDASDRFESALQCWQLAEAMAAAAEARVHEALDAYCEGVGAPPARADQAIAGALRGSAQRALQKLLQLESQERAALRLL